MGTRPKGNRGATVCANDVLESVRIVDARLVDAIARTVLRPAARRLVLATAEEALPTRIAAPRETAAELR